MKRVDVVPNPASPPRDRGASQDAASKPDPDPRLDPRWPPADARSIEHREFFSLHAL